MSETKSNLILIITMFLIGICVTGGTYAYWTWNSTQTKNVIFNVGNLSEHVIYNEGKSHFVGDFRTSSNYCGGISNTIYFYKTDVAENAKIVATINMNVNRIEAPIASSSNVHWILTKLNNNDLFEENLEKGDAVDMSSLDCSVIMANSSVVKDQNGNDVTGTFNGIVNNSSFVLKSDLELLSGVSLESDNLDIDNISIYTIWIWIDTNGGDDLSGKMLDTNIWTQFDLVDVES